MSLACFHINTEAFLGDLAMAKRQSPAAPALRPVIVCTEYKGVFFGLASDTTGDSIHLKDARMAISYNTTRGVMELAETGPPAGSKISAKADIEVRKITAVFETTEAAAKVWSEIK
jgi:hypothetical protein